MDHLFRKTVKNDPVETGNSDPLITGIGDPVGLELLIHYDWNMQNFQTGENGGRFIVIFDWESGGYMEAYHYYPR